MSLVSVIMPVYNAEQYVGQAIQSIIEQTYGNWELLICDDGSTDNSISVIKGFEAADIRIKVLQNKRNQGKVKTVNTLFEKIKGEFITIHDADDWSEKNRFEVQMQLFKKNPNLAATGTFINVVDRTGNLIRQEKKNISDTKIKEQMIAHNQFCGATIVMKKAVVGEQIYREFFNEYNCEDYDLSLRIAENHFVHNVDKYLYNYRQHENSLSKRVSLNALISDELVRYLAQQRKNGGLDFIDKGETEKLKHLIKNLKEKIDTSPSFIYKRYSENFIYSKLYKKAIITSFKGILAEPWKFDNYRVFQYCLRKAIINF